MNVKKRILSGLLALCMVLAMMPTAFAAYAPKPFAITNETLRLSLPPNSNKSYEVQADSLDYIFKVLNGEATPPPRNIFGSKDALDTTSDVIIWLKDENDTVFDKDLTVENRLFRIVWTYVDREHTHKVDLTGKFSVNSGGTLILAGGMTRGSSGGHANVTVRSPIEVNEGGTLYIECNPAASNTNDVYTSASADQPIIKMNGGTLHIGTAQFVVPENSTAPAILVEGGNVIVHEKTAAFHRTSENHLIPDYSVKNNDNGYGASTVAETNSSPVIEVRSGGTLTLDGGAFTNTGDLPAITVASGATLVIPEGSTARVTTSNPDTKAIDLAPGSTVQQGDTAITISGSSQAGESYVDNDGVIHLAAGSTVGDKTLESGGTVDSSGAVTENTVPVQSVTLDKPTLSLAVGGSEALAATVLPADAADKNVTWTSSDENIATVDAAGTVTAVAEGTATITATAGGKTASCVVTVSPAAIPVTGISLDKPALALAVGERGTLTATVSPENATDTVVWSSDNGAVATVDQSGVVTAVAAGKAVITATAGGVSATCDVTVSAPYVPVPPVIPVQPVTPTQPTEPDTPDVPDIPAPGYADVSANDWFYNEVSYVTAKGLMRGTTATTFAPNATTTRAMVWTILGRMTGAKVDGGEPWYSLAQTWAVSESVSDGTNPNGSITREELAVMLYRYAGSPAVGLSDLAKLGQFTDGETVSDWAQEAMAWAVSNGVISGSGSALNPQASATRAQVAAMLMRLCETMDK